MIRHEFDHVAWSRLDIFNQLGNIGSEVGRAMKAKRAGNKQDTTAAFYRGLDLFDATLTSPVMSGEARKRELLRARELFVESIITDRVDLGLENYFMQFAIVARMRQFK